MKFGLSALQRFWPVAPVALLGVVIGVVGWGGFNTAMEATNSLGFCVSCHEMRDNVYEEYKKTVTTATSRACARSVRTATFRTTGRTR